MEKFKRVKISTPAGDAYLSYKPVVNDTSEISNHVCNYLCPYGKSCEHIRDPRDPENESKTFHTFCSCLGKEGSECEDNELLAMVPVEGTIEDNIPEELNIFRGVIDKDPSIKLSTLIKTFCKSNCCFYTEDLSKCNPSDKLCIIRGLYSGPMEKIKIEPYDPDIAYLEELDKKMEEEKKKLEDANN